MSKLFAAAKRAREGERLLLGWRRLEDLQVLTALRDAGVTPAGDLDVVNEAGERRNAADEEGDYGAPVATPSLRVAVHALEVVHVGNRHIPASDEVVAVARHQWISGY